MAVETMDRKKRQDAVVQGSLKAGEVYVGKPINTVVIDTTSYKAPETGNYYAVDRITDPKRPQATLVPRYGQITPRTAEQLKARGIYKLRVTTEKPTAEEKA